MSSITFHIPDSLARKLNEVARAEGVTLDQLLSSVTSEILSNWMTVNRLHEMASAARHQDFIAFLDQSPEVPPVPRDD